MIYKCMLVSDVQQNAPHKIYYKMITLTGPSYQLPAYTVLMTVFNYYSFVVGLTSESVMPPALFFFLKIVLTIQGLWWHHKNLRVICSGPVQNAMGILDKDWIESVLQGYNGHFPNIHSSNLWTCISFDFFVSSSVSFINGSCLFSLDEIYSWAFYSLWCNYPRGCFIYLF